MDKAVLFDWFAPVLSFTLSITIVAFFSRFIIKRCVASRKWSMRLELGWLFCTFFGILLGIVQLIVNRMDSAVVSRLVEYESLVSSDFAKSTTVATVCRSIIADNSSVFYNVSNGSKYEYTAWCMGLELESNLLSVLHKEINKSINNRSYRSNGLARVINIYNEIENSPYKERITNIFEKFGYANSTYGLMNKYDRALFNPNIWLKFKTNQIKEIDDIKVLKNDHERIGRFIFPVSVWFFVVGVCISLKIIKYEIDMKIIKQLEKV